MADREVLPQHVKPVHYDLSLFNLVLSDPFSYDGSVAIELELKEATSSITLNYKQLKLKDGLVELDGGKSLKVNDIAYDEKKETAKLSLDGELPAAGSATLKINFSGTMNNEMAGFYRSSYKNAAGNPDFMFSTQFESCAARQAFPCMDEPNLKATFDVQIEVPDAFTALSNQPEKETKPSKKDGLKIVSFTRTPKMSTYLLAWACGDFEYVEDFTEREYPKHGKLPVRVYTTKGLKEQGRFALGYATKIVDYYSEIFKIDYPLPKVDLLAVHEFSHGAMENWGLITYRTTAVLFDEKTSDSRYKNRVAYVVAHELAHQWFGNLVTMDWWNGLWLNEGFATWAGWYAIDHFNPSWDVWGQFVTEGVQTAFQLDSLRGSHPIEVPVKNALDIGQVFDAISYLKGSSMIRMLSSHLSVDTFLSGVSAYLKKHAYANATTEDLWAALDEASSQDVTGFMSDWIKKIGFPVLTVTEDDAAKTLTIKQTRFLSTGDVKEDEDLTTWWIPLFMPDTNLSSASTKVHSLHAKEAHIDNMDLSTGSYKLNFGQRGFYRVNYPPSRLEKLGKVRSSLSVADKVGLIADASAIAFSGLGNSTGLLNFIAECGDEDSYLVWAEIVEQLGKLRSVFAETDDQIVKDLKRLTLDLVLEPVQNVGWNPKQGEDFLTQRLRSLLITAAGGAGHEPTINEAKRRFAVYMQGDKDAIHPNLKLAVFRIAIGEGGIKEVEEVIKEYTDTTTVDGQEICLSSLGRVCKDECIARVLEFWGSDNIKTQDLHTPAIALGANSKSRGKWWEYVQANWESVEKKACGNVVVLDRLLKTSLNKFSSFEKVEEIEEFFKGKDTEGFDKGLAVIRDTVRGNAQYVQRDREVVKKWLGGRYK